MLKWANLRKTGDSFWGRVSVHTPVLVLNHNYQPLHVCNTRRALILLYLGKAEVVENGRGYVRAPSRLFPRPSVIRLNRTVSRPYPRVKLSKKEIFRRDNFTCQYCGRLSRHLTVDHVVPRHRGGTPTWDNLVSACHVCNRRKGGRTPQEANMKLLRAAFEPHANGLYMFRHYLEEYQEWRRFIEGW